MTLAAIVVAAFAGGAFLAGREWPFLAAALVPLALAAGLWLIWPSPRRWRVAAFFFFGAIAMPPLAVWTHQVICLYGPRPAAMEQTLFQGVEYVREIVGEAEPAVAHLVRVDLTADGVEMLVTPPDAPGEERAFYARTTSAFLREFDVQVAINAAHYGPLRAESLLSFYPRPGDPVSVIGASVSKGTAYGEPRSTRPMLNVTADNHAQIGIHPPQPWHNAVTGTRTLLRDGELTTEATASGREAFTVVATDAAGKTLWLLVVDGRQPPYSHGLDRRSIAELLLRHGAHDAIELDGGGSSAMVTTSPAPFVRSRQLNRPVNLNVPRLERPVGTHIGIRARPAGGS